MSKAIETRKDQSNAVAVGDIERLLAFGDLAKLSEEQRIDYYNRMCEAVGVSPIFQPFTYINFKGSLKLFPSKNCADLIRRQYGASVTITSRTTTEDGFYIVTARASTPDGRFDEGDGVVSLGVTKGEDRANLMMKAETKAKKRATFSLFGLGEVEFGEIEMQKEIRAKRGIGDIAGVEGLGSDECVTPKAVVENPPFVDRRTEELKASIDAPIVVSREDHLSELKDIAQELWRTSEAGWESRLNDTAKHLTNSEKLTADDLDSEEIQRAFVFLSGVLESWKKKQQMPAMEGIA